MKRINTPDNSFDSLKPLFGTKGHPPFYDPNDIHTHVWKKGKLGIEDDPKIPIYSKEKMCIKNCTYCKICHKKNNYFESNIKNNNIESDIIPKNNEHIEIGYKIKANIIPMSDVNINDENYKTYDYNNDYDLTKLFHRTEHITGDYVTFE
jgi:hypothetical protein